MKSLSLVTTYALLLLIGCAGYDVRRGDLPAEDFRRFSQSRVAGMKQESPFLKLHMKDGDLYIFSSWDTDESRSFIAGTAILYDPSRQIVDTATYNIGLDSVALIETNTLEKSGASAAITLFTGITVGFTVFCIANPKACFGSCPTFYTSDGDSMRLQAEGFSSSIAPSLEATDVDALYHAKPSRGKINLEMRNEALETHVVRQVDLLVVPRAPHRRVLHEEDGRFRQATRMILPTSARGPEGNCLAKLFSPDGIERFSLADSLYLAEKESVELEFPVQPGMRYGLAVGCRQTLLPTYLLYQTLAYMGNDAGYWLAQLERKKIGSEQGAVERSIGGIDVFNYGSEGKWLRAGRIDEHGPLAADMHLIPLESDATNGSVIKVQLHMTKGAWRIDYVALAELSGTVEPIRLRPSSVLRGNQVDEAARTLLLDSAKVLVTLPGDTYTLQYDLPDSSTNYDLFLESRGYYLEWIRKEWVVEENPLLLAEIFLTPEFALRRMAPEFKSIESHMEDSFWRSRYAKP